MSRRLHTIISSFALVSVLTMQNGSPANPKQISLPGDAIITFEEPIPAPGNLQSQYCNNPATNKGVQFV
jgi:hypothetical protein